MGNDKPILLNDFITLHPAVPVQDVLSGSYRAVKSKVVEDEGERLRYFIFCIY